MSTKTERLVARVTGTAKRRRPMTDDERAQQAVRTRRAWADGRFANRRKPMHRRAWTPEHDRALAALAGTMPVPEIADELERRFCIRRTEAGIRIRAKRLGVSLWQGGYSLRDLERVFGVSHHTLLPHWVGAGHLTGRRWTGRGPNAGWWFDGAEVERFVRACGWLYAVERMRPGHPLTRLAETVRRSEPWVVGLEAVGALLGLAPVNLKKWLVRGLVPHRRRPGAGGHGELCVRGRDIPAIRAAVAAERERTRAANVARFTAMRRGELEAAS